MDTLTQWWKKLSLNDNEGGEFQIEKTTEVPNYTIAAKFLTKRALNTEAIIKTFNSIWRSKNGFKVAMWETIFCYLCSTMRKKLKEFLKGSYGALINT